MFTQGWIDRTGSLFLVEKTGGLFRVPLERLIPFFPDEVKSGEVQPVSITLDTITDTAVTLVCQLLVTGADFRLVLPNRDLKQIGVVVIISPFTKIPVYVQTLLYLQEECRVSPSDFDKAIILAITAAKNRPDLAEITVH